MFMTKNLQIISFYYTGHKCQKREWNLNQIRLHSLPLSIQENHCISIHKPLIALWKIQNSWKVWWKHIMVSNPPQLYILHMQLPNTSYVPLVFLNYFSLKIKSQFSDTGKHVPFTHACLTIQHCFWYIFYVKNNPLILPNATRALCLENPLLT